MTRYERIAQRAIQERYGNHKEPVTLFNIACDADEAARSAGKKRELHASLYDYVQHIPSGWRCAWLGTDKPNSDKLFMAIPPGWHSGDTRSQSLLLGGGRLVEK